MNRWFMIAALALGTTLPATADPILEKMREHTNDGPLYAYELSYMRDGLTATGKVDPSAAAGERIEIYTPQPADWPDGFEGGVEALDEDSDGDIWCSEFAPAVPDTAIRISEDADSVTYEFTPNAKPDADRMERKLMKRVVGQAVLSKQDGALQQFSLRLPRPYKPVMVAKVDTFELDIECARAPDGRTYIESFSMEVVGSAMMQAFEDRERWQITSLLGVVEG